LPRLSSYFLSPRNPTPALPFLRGGSKVAGFEGVLLLPLKKGEAGRGFCGNRKPTIKAN